jgi:hypothetical protein
MADTENQSGLDAVDQAADTPVVSGLSIAGQKKVSLGGPQSQEVKDQLMKIIQQREAEKNSLLGNFTESMARFAGPTSGWAAQQQAYNQTQEQRNNDITQARVAMANIDSQQAQQAQDQAVFNRIIGAGAAQPQAKARGAAPTQGSAQADLAPILGGQVPLTQEQQLQLYALHRVNPQAAITKAIELRKLTDTQRELVSAGVVPGSDPWNRAMVLHAAGAGAFQPHEMNVPGGTVQQTPWQAVPTTQSGALPAAPAPAAPAAPAARSGALPSAPSVAPAQPAAPAPAPTSTGFIPGSKQDLAIREAEAKSKAAGMEAESRKVGENYAAQQTAHETEAMNAPDNAALAQRMQQDIKSSNGVLGKLAKPGAMSAFLGLVDQGVQLGEFGAVKIPGLQDTLVKLDPAAKDKNVMDAYVRLGRDLTKMQLDYSQKVLKGQGSVSDNERRLMAEVIGDRAHSTPASLMQMAKGVELEARNRVEQDRLWKEMKKAGHRWSEFQDSPELADMRKKQFYRTAKVFGRADAKYPGDQ